MKSQATTFAAAVEAARRSGWTQGWTLAQIAAALGVSLSTVQSWLKPAATSRREAPSWAVLALLSLQDGRIREERRGDILITYCPARQKERR